MTRFLAPRKRPEPSFAFSCPCSHCDWLLAADVTSTCALIRHGGCKTRKLRKRFAAVMRHSHLGSRSILPRIVALLRVSPISCATHQRDLLLTGCFKLRKFYSLWRTCQLGQRRIHLIVASPLQQTRAARYIKDQAKDSGE